MCEVAQKPTQFRFNLNDKAKANESFIRAPTMEFLINKFSEPHVKKFGTAEYSKQNVGIATNDLIPKRSNYIGMLKPPKISKSFSDNLVIGSEIDKLLSNDIYFNYVLFSILKILNNTLDEYQSSGRVEVVLETDEDNPKWKHADINVKLDDDSLGSEIWKKASKDAKNFYKTLEVSKKMPSETIRRIHKFIYIMID